MRKKQLFSFLLILVVGVMVSCISCTKVDIDSLDITDDITDYQKGLIQSFGYPAEFTIALYAIRWSNGTIEVYDQTDYLEMDKVLQYWNNILNSTQFKLSSDPNSPIKITFNETLNNECNAITVWWENYTIYKGLVEINPAKDCNNFLNYLHAFGHVIGFAKDTKPKITGENIMNAIPTTDKVEGVVKDMLQGLYELEPGYYLGTYCYNCVDSIPLNY
jgi:hypothetical protein